MKIEVLGAGCAKCRATKKLITGVVQDLQVNTEVVLVSDFNEIVDRGVMATPAVFVDGELKCTGRVPSKEDVKGWLAGTLVEQINGGVTVEVENRGAEQCACLYYLQEQAKMIKKEPSLYRLTCKECGIAFSSNVQKDYCFECEKKV